MSLLKSLFLKAFFHAFLPFLELWDGTTSLLPCPATVIHHSISLRQMENYVADLVLFR